MSLLNCLGASGGPGPAPTGSLARLFLRSAGLRPVCAFLRSRHGFCC